MENITIFAPSDDAIAVGIDPDVLTSTSVRKNCLFLVPFPTVSNQRKAKFILFLKTDNRNSGS
jgi:hypothetical protein